MKRAPEDIDEDLIPYSVTLGLWETRVKALSPLHAIEKARRNFSKEWPIFYHDIHQKSWEDFSVTPEN